MKDVRHLLGVTVLLASLAACSMPTLGPILGQPREPVRWTLLVAPPSPAAEQTARASMDDAELLIASFAFRHDFGRAYERGLAREVQVFATKAAFDRFLQVTGEWPAQTPVPENVVAVFNNGRLLAAAEEDARRTNPAIDSHDAYVRILAHELVHGLHVAVLRGDKSAMGPRWFFEGFAVAAAGQFDEQQISAADYRAVIAGLPKADYRLFGAAVRKLAQTHTYAELIERARKPDFDTWALGAVKF